MSQVKGKSYWRSIDQFEDAESAKLFREREFQEGASELTDVTRRSFLKIMGASAALAGAAGCSVRKPVQKIYPYAKRPEDVIPGRSKYYATAMVLGERVSGVLVESYSGRPTKIEGNPLHESNRGATGVYEQASILNLYDPDRLRYPSFNKDSRTILEFKEWFKSFLDEQSKTKGNKLAVLMGQNMSPTVSRLLKKAKQRFPYLSVYRYEPVNREPLYEAINDLSGASYVPSYNVEDANIIVSFGSDFLGQGPDQLEMTRQFSNRRDPDSKTQKMNRLYVMESVFSITGGKADHRFCLKPSQIEQAAWVIAQKVVEVLNPAISSNLKTKISRMAELYKAVLSEKEIKAISSDLILNRGKSLILGDSSLSKSLQYIVILLNSLLGNDGKTVLYSSLPFSGDEWNKMNSDESLTALVEDVNKGSVDSLLVLDSDPIFTAPKQYNLEKAFAKLKNVVSLSNMETATTRLSNWVIPLSHYLESWGDAVALSGKTSLIQPLLKPMYESLSIIDIAGLLAGEGKSDYALVRETARSRGQIGSWEKWLHDGVGGTVNPSVSPKWVNIENSLVSAKGKVKNDSIEVVYKSDYSIYDGRFMNNGWLQEMPDPITKLAWDNALLVSPSFARKNKLKTGDMVEVSTESSSLKSVVMVLPGTQEDTISITLGYGSAVAGRVGKGTGFNAYSLKRSTQSNVEKVLKVAKLNKTYDLSTTQEHGSLEGRPHFAQATMKEYKAHPHFAKELEEVPANKSLYDERLYDTGQQWGMAIDLSKCTGCNACVVGCQAENNIPIVGKKEVANGREMHWIRLDRYFEGSEENPDLVHQPVTCLQCENAPCEQVCPVAATTHSEDGLNQMTYNRCIGTRYCANNCPVKVRRFNFFDYHQKNPQSVKKDRQHMFDYLREPDKSVQKQFNPNVTVRMRGVMEKCTFCVQRIQKARIDSKVSGKPVKDGQIETACSQVCPANAIVFGDINDKNSKVFKLKQSNREYEILRGLRLKARTTFLASITNPHPLLVKVDTHNTKHENKEAHS